MKSILNFIINSWKIFDMYKIINYLYMSNIFIILLSSPKYYKRKCSFPKLLYNKLIKLTNFNN